MKDADDPIPMSTPEDTILLSDAFVVVYRALTPDWQILEKQLYPSPPYYALEDSKNDPRREALHNRDKAHRRANEWLREKISQGALRALVRDPGDPNSKPPRPPQTFQLTRRGWAPSGFETGIDDDHVGPDDIHQSGPNTIIAGARRPVFFDRKEFDNLVAEITRPTTKIDKSRATDKGGRPAEYDWDAMKAFALQQIATLGKPNRKNKRLPTKAQLIELIQNEWRDRFDLYPPNSSVRRHLNRWLAEIDQN